MGLRIQHSMTHTSSIRKSLLNVAPALATLLLAPVLISCGNGSDGKISDPADVPTFVEKAKELGFVLSHGPRLSEPNCLFDPGIVVKKFPKVTPAGSSKDLARQCNPERSAGGAAAVDVNGDGLDDLVITRIYDHPLLYLNESKQGKPAFREATVGSGFEKIKDSTNAVGYADIDKDGDQDVFFTSLGGPRSFLFVNDGSGKFVDEAESRGVAMLDGLPHSGTGVAFGDYDNDGWVDIHTGEWQLPDVSTYVVPSHSRLFRNLGASGKPGYYEDTTVKAGVSLESRIDLVYSFSSSFTDFDEDGFVDLMIASDFDTSRLYWNNGDGTFTNGTVDAEVGKEENGMGLAVGFLGTSQKQVMMVTSIRAKPDCDDESDLILTGNRMYEYAGNRKFNDITDKAGVRNGFWGWGVSFLDATNAGKNDVAMANGIDITWMQPSDCYATDPFRLWLDNGEGVFTENSQEAGIDVSTPTKGVVVFDADNDGRQDLFITRDSNTPLFFHNQTPQVGSWLSVNVVGLDSNANAIGAKVTVTTSEEGPSKLAFVGTTGSFLTQDSASEHFGLGNFTKKIHEVRVDFPATKRSVTLRDVTANQEIKIVEPAS
jgi:hypothetical protein